jgi:hypothetical protein
VSLARPKLSYASRSLQGRRRNKLSVPLGRTAEARSERGEDEEASGFRPFGSRSDWYARLRRTSSAGDDHNICSCRRRGVLDPSCVVTAVQLPGGTAYVASGTYTVSVSGSGGFTFRCSANLISGSTKSGLVSSPDPSLIGCWNGVSFALTANWRLVIAPSGQVTYTCTV